MRKIPQSDIGNIFRVQFRDGDIANALVDISAATARQIVFTDPDGTDSVKTAAFTTDGSDGQIEYKRLSGEFSQLGIWSYRGKVTLGAADVYSGSVPTEFEVVE